MQCKREDRQTDGAMRSNSNKQKGRVVVVYTQRQDNHTRQVGEGCCCGHWLGWLYAPLEGFSASRMVRSKFMPWLNFLISTIERFSSNNLISVPVKEIVSTSGL